MVGVRDFADLRPKIVKSLSGFSVSPILLGIKERERKKKKSRRKKRKGLVSTPFSGHPLDALMFNLDKNFPFQREIAMK